jgi:hypothetical protein
MLPCATVTIGNDGALLKASVTYSTINVGRNNDDGNTVVYTAIDHNTDNEEDDDDDANGDFSANAGSSALAPSGLQPHATPLDTRGRAASYCQPKEGVASYTLAVPIHGGAAVLPLESEYKKVGGADGTGHGARVLACGVISVVAEFIVSVAGVECPSCVVPENAENAAMCPFPYHYRHAFHHTTAGRLIQCRSGCT